jgi:hypothetical protein
MAKRKANLNGAATNGNGHHKSNGNGHAETFDIKELGQLLRLNAQENVELTLELAKELLATPAFIGERPVRKRHIADLAKHMRDGTFHWNMVSIITCRCNEPHNDKPRGTTFRMNGQHTCHARLELPASYRAPVRLMRYSASTEADMRRLYATIDRGAPRTKHNVIHSYICGTEEFDSFPFHVRKFLPFGMAIWRWEDSAARAAHNGEDIAHLLLKSERSLVQTVSAFLAQFSTAEHKHIMRGPVVAAMLETFSKSVAKSTEFWTAVATGLNLTSERDPRKKLHKQLISTAIYSGNRQHKGRVVGAQSLPQESMYRLCIQMWNAWRKGETVQAIRLPEKRPMAIA